MLWMRGTKNFMLKIVSFTCNACGTDGDDSPFVCTVCQLIVHKTCISFPRSIKLRIHRHPRIIHTYHLQQCNSRNKYCGICRDGVDTNYGVYYCQDCDFVAHVNCGIQYRQSNTESDEDERSITMNDEFIESSFDIIREIKHGDERIIAEIKHFSHQHNLILSDEFSTDLKCDGCMLPICTPFYSCTGCNFSLDKACIRLPRRNFWQYHGHPLTLILNTREKYPFQCVVCKQYCHGFMDSATITIHVITALTCDASYQQKIPLNIVVTSIPFILPWRARIVIAVAVVLVQSMALSGALIVTSTWILNVLLCQIKLDTGMINILSSSLILIQMTTNMSVKFAKKKETQRSGSIVVKNATSMLIRNAFLGNIHLSS